MFCSECGVGRAEEFAAGFVGDLLQRVFIDIDLGHRQALVAEGVGDGHRRLAAHAGADGVNLDAERLRGLRGGFGHDLAGVVLAVGQEHDDLRFARLLAQAVDARGQRRADGGAVFHGADLHAVEVLLEPVVIERERADEIRRAGETDEADAVVGPRVDELRDDGFHDIEPVGGLAFEFEVERFHRARAVHGEDHVHAAGFDGGGAAAKLRPGERDDEQREREEVERRKPFARAAPRLAGHLAGDVGAGVFHRGDRAAPSAQEREQRQQGEQPEERWVEEADHGSGWVRRWRRRVRRLRDAGVGGRGLFFAGLGLPIATTKALALASMASICGTVSDQRANFARSQCVRKSSSASRCSDEHAVRHLQQVVQELVGGAMRGAHRQAFLDEEPHDFRNREREGVRAFRLHERAELLEIRERDFIRQLAPRATRAAPTRRSRDLRRRASPRSRQPTESGAGIWIGPRMSRMSSSGAAGAAGAEWAPVAVGGGDGHRARLRCGERGQTKETERDDGGSLLGGEGREVGRRFFMSVCGCGF